MHDGLFRFLTNEQALECFSTVPHFSAMYFSRSHGPAILKDLTRRIPEARVVLDLGCGRGDFLDLLVESGFQCMG